MVTNPHCSITMKSGRMMPLWKKSLPATGRMILWAGNKHAYRERKIDRIVKTQKRPEEDVNGWIVVLQESKANQFNSIK